MHARVAHHASRRIAELAAAQHGVVGRAQLESLGLRRGAIDHRLAAGTLHRVHRGVYAVGHRILTSEGRWMAAVLACGDGAVASHRTAAAAWEIRPTATAAVDVTVPDRKGRRPRGGIVLHRSATLRPGDTVRRGAIPVTSPARTLLDLAEVVDIAALERAIERAEMLGLFDLHAVRAVLATSPRRRGSSKLARALERDHTDVSVTRSELEEVFLRLCVAGDIVRPLVNARVEGYEADFLWPEVRLVVETDGRQSHGTHVAFERDRARDAHLVAAGYRVVRFTHSQVTRSPAEVTALLRSLLDGRSHPGSRSKGLDKRLPGAEGPSAQASRQVIR